jgi:hypothetical protein
LYPSKLYRGDSGGGGDGDGDSVGGDGNGDADNDICDDNVYGVKNNELRWW